MAKTVDDTVLDASFDTLDQADLMTACSAQPLNFTEATTDLGSGGYKLADVAMIPDTDFTKADGSI
jgi:hypothetical protein